MTPNNSVTPPSRESVPVAKHDEELDLLDLIAQLWRGKMTIIAAVVVFVILAGVYLAFAKETWTSRTIVSQPASGMIANYNASLSVLYTQSPTDKPSLPDLQQQFFTRFTATMSALALALQNQVKPQVLKVEQVNKGSNDQFSIAFSAHTAKDAQAQLAKYVEQVNDKIVDSYAADLRRTVGVKTRELTSSLEAQKQVAIDKQQQRLKAIRQALLVAQASDVKSSGLNQAEYLSDDTLYLLGTSALQSMIQNESTRPLVFEQSYYDTQSALLEVTHLKIDLAHLQSYRYIAEPDLPVRRDSPKRTLVMLLAIILGGIAGSALVIGRNAMASYSLRKNS